MFWGHKAALFAFFVYKSWFQVFNARFFSSMSTELYLAQFNWSLQYKSSLPLRFDKLLEKSAPDAAHASL